MERTSGMLAFRRGRIEHQDLLMQQCLQGVELSGWSLPIIDQRDQMGEPDSEPDGPFGRCNEISRIHGRREPRVQCAAHRHECATGI